MIKAPGGRSLFPIILAAIIGTAVISVALYFTLLRKPADEPRTAPVAPSTENKPRTPPPAPQGVVDTKSVEVLLVASLPLQATIVVQGTVSDQCTSVSSASTERRDRTFTITLTTSRNKSGACENTPKPFEKRIAISTAGLNAGTYTVKVGDASAEFTLKVAKKP